MGNVWKDLHHLKCLERTLDLGKAPKTKQKRPNHPARMKQLAYTGLVRRNDGPPTWNLRIRWNKNTSHSKFSC